MALMLRALRPTLRQNLLVPLERQVARHMASQPEPALVDEGKKDIEDPERAVEEWQDDSFDRFRAVPTGDPTKRGFHYATLGATRLLLASGVRIAVMKAIHSCSASADVLALASVEVDIDKVKPGETIAVKWRGKPVYIKRRTEEEIAKAREDDNADLRDREKDSVRCQKPEWLIVLGVCTHLGCVPAPNAGDFRGWFCPCHGSTMISLAESARDLHL